MKNLIMLMVCVLLAVGVAGCEEEKSTSQMKEFAVQAEKWVASMDEYQAVAGEMLETAKTHGIVGDTVVKKVEKVSEEIDRVQPQIADVVAAMINADTSGDDEVTNWVKLIQAANQGSAPWNPYVIPIAAVSELALLLWGLIKRKQAVDNKQEAEKNRLKYQAHKQGAKLTALENPDFNAKLYRNIGDARANLGVK